MKLLLLLSALLAALTGAGADARAPRAQAVAAVAVGRVVEAVTPAHAHVVAASIRPIARSSRIDAAPLVEILLRTAPRLWAERRRE